MPQTEPPIIRPGQIARFRELVSWWADRLGRHQVPLREGVEDIRDLLTHDAVHHELIQEIVRGVYCRNRCGHLDAAINLEETFSALGRVREKLLQSRRSDVDQINLLDNIGWYTRQYFGPAHETQRAREVCEPADDALDIQSRSRATI